MLMKPWEFVVERPEDLPVFADLLEEWGHPGVSVVRKLIKYGKFPKEVRSRGQDLWAWCVIAAVTQMDKEAHELPDGSLANDWNSVFYNPTEAIWAVVNAGHYITRPWDPKK